MTCRVILSPLHSKEGSYAIWHDVVFTLPVGSGDDVGRSGRTGIYEELGDIEARVLSELSRPDMYRLR